MTQERFKWHPEARLTCGDAPMADDQLPDLLMRLRQDTTPGSHSEARGPALLETRTGGSSGQPKRITRTHASWIGSFDINAGLFGIGPGQSVAVLGGFDHSLTLYAAVEAVHLGARLHFLGGLPPACQRSLLERLPATVLYATPTQLRLLAATKGREIRATLQVLCGGGPLDDTTRARAEALFPKADIHGFYGAAETSFVTLQTPDAPPGSVGLPYPGVTLRILDADGRETTGTGEVWVQSPYLAEAVNDLPLPRRDGFVTAGEIGWRGANGALFLAGRGDRRITIADQTVHPEQTEAAIAPFALNVVLPRPDPLRGQVLVAIVAGPCPEAQMIQIRAACAASLPPLNRPRRIFIHPGFPLLASGKPDRRALSQWLKEQT